MDHQNIADVENDSTPANKDGFSSNPSFIKNRANIAIYDDFLSAPRIIKIEPGPTREYIESLATQTYTASQQAGGSIPYTVIREVAENFIHADFKEPVVSILDRGNTIKFADQGPGIRDKEKAQLPGYTSATSDMKDYIRGVGSGFPIVREYMTIQGGKLEIDDNVKDGTVVTLSLEQEKPLHRDQIKQTSPTEQRFSSPSLSQIKISQREDSVLKLFIDKPSIGPTDIKNSLGLSLGTASRTLDALEESGYIMMNDSKKRVLTDDGIKYLRDNYRKI